MYVEEQGEAKKEERQWGKQRADLIELRVHEQVDKTDDKRKAAARSFLVCDLGASCRSVARLCTVTEAASERLANLPLPVESTAENRNTWVRRCSMTALLDTVVGPSYMTLLLDSLARDSYLA